MKSLLIASLLLLFSVQSPETPEEKKINWMTIEEVEAAAAKEPRKVIIDVYTDWCGWCKRMDQTTFKNEVIVDYINENYYAVKLNAEQKDSIRFKDHTFKYIAQGKRGYHELAAALLQGRMSYPSIVYLDEELNMIQPVPGFMNPKNMEQLITYFAEDYYKSIPFEEYKETFESKIEG